MEKIMTQNTYTSTSQEKTDYFSIGNTEEKLIFWSNITTEIIKEKLRQKDNRKIALFSHHPDEILKKFKQVSINPNYLEKSISTLVMIEKKREEFVENILKAAVVMYPHHRKLIEDKENLLRQKIHFAEGNNKIVRSVCIMFWGLLNNPNDSFSSDYWR